MMGEGEREVSLGEERWERPLCEDRPSVLRAATSLNGQGQECGRCEYKTKQRDKQVKN